jgi:nucleotide-binding universal stress UspA family protein
MFKNILIPLTGFASDTRALETALVIGTPFDAALQALHIQPEAMDVVLSAAMQQFGTRKSNRELVLSLQKDAQVRTQNAKESFDRFFQLHFPTQAFGSAKSGCTLSWRAIEGHSVEGIIADARYNDLVVLAHPPEGGEFSLDAMANILVGCGRPVVLAPEANQSRLGHDVAIAWKESAEAARAVTAAMPMLARAKKIFVLSADEEGKDPELSTKSSQRLAEHLARHGLTVEAHGFVAKPHMAAETLVRKAKELGADILVSGAYSHGRVRELVFGGFTRTLLARCELPVFFLH